jgi:outer membrane lipoprotein-sorting protein
MNTHKHINKILTAFVLEELSEQDASKVQAHLAECSRCSDEVERLRALLKCSDDMSKLSVDELVCESAKRRILRSAEETEASERLNISHFYLWRTIMKSPVIKIAAVIVIAAAVLIGIYQFGGSTPAFADIVRPILFAHTATFAMTVQVGDVSPFTAQGMFMEPGMTRLEISFDKPRPMKQIQIMDYIKGRGLFLVPEQKIAVVTELKNRPEQMQLSQFNTFEDMRIQIREAQENADESVEYLGQRTIDGRQVIGYGIVQSGVEMSIWADSQSLLPVQVEYSFGEDMWMGKQGTIVMDDIVFDVPLDDELFSVEVPDGYTTAHTMQIDASEPTESDLIEALRMWADLSGGEFPSALNMGVVEELAKVLESKGDLKRVEGSDLSDPKFKEFMDTYTNAFVKISRGFMFVHSLPEQSDWHYAGQEATTEDLDTAIFWYKPEGTEMYRVIYADLTVAETYPEDLPQ